uniref:Integrase catalytic domain-containing protein n=1 Tax=Tanacetum cinerariifolium TaxID=118510 RepID=A0A6L2JIY9_TANCI|nr:hypothetical protein [Tanacetum cinerariifolium]
MANDGEDHALVADEEVPTEFALMANTSTENKVFDNSLCSKDCKKNNDSLNSKITDLTDKLFDAKNMIYHYKLGLAQVESRLVEHKDREIKYYEKIRGLEFRTESNNECIEILKKKLETLKKEKEGVDGKLAGLLTASKDLDNLIESQRADKNMQGLGYSAVPHPPAQIYSSPKKDLSWTGLPEPSPTMESTSGDDHNKNPSVSETEASPSTITPKPFIKFVKASPDFVMKKKACFNYGDFNHLAYDCIKRVKKGTSRSQDNTHKSFTPRPLVHRPYRPPVRPMRTNMNDARPNRTSFNKQAHSYANRPFQRTSAVRSQFRAPWVPTANMNFPLKFSTGGTKFSTADMGKKGKAVKPSACWFWKHSQNSSNKGPNNNSVSVMFKKYTYIDTQGGCKITGKGTTKTGKLEFENVYFVKDLKYNLFSASQISDNKNNVLFTNSECIVLGRDFKLLDDANILLRTPRQHNMRLGHLNFKTMNKLVRHNLVRGLPTKCFENDHTCTACLKGKQHKASYEASDVIISFIKKTQVNLQLQVQHVRADNGTEFKNKTLAKFFDEVGITQQFYAARTTQQNGVVERKNRTLVEAARTMLTFANLPLFLWAEAITTACFTQNRSIIHKRFDKTPFELIIKRKPNIKFFCVFGCRCYLLNDYDDVGKLKAKGDIGVFVGYSKESAAFRIYNKRNRKIHESVNVNFDEISEMASNNSV